MKFQIITVGKLKEKYLKDGIAEYLKRLQRYAVVEIVEVADEQTPDGASEAEEAQIKAKEAQRIQKYIKDDTVCSVKYANLHFPFQLPHRIGQTRLGNEQLFRCFRNISGFRNRYDVFQLLQSHPLYLSH